MTNLTGQGQSAAMMTVAFLGFLGVGCAAADGADALLDVREFLGYMCIG